MFASAHAKTESLSWSPFAWRHDIRVGLAGFSENVQTDAAKTDEHANYVDGAQFIVVDHHVQTDGHDFLINKLYIQFSRLFIT